MDNRPSCCNKPMHKAGKGWSGRNRIQRFRCNQCGRTTQRIADDIEMRNVIGPNK